MMRRGRMLGAGGLLVASVAVGVATNILGSSRGEGKAGMSPYGADDLAWTLAQIAFIAVGLLVTLRARQRVVGAMFLLVGLTTLFGTFAYEYAYSGIHVAPDLPAAEAATVFYYVLNTPVGGWFTLGMLVFPTGRLPSRRWIPVVVLALTGIVSAVIAAGMLWPKRGAALLLEVPNLEGAPGLAFDLPYLLLVPSIFFGFASVLARFRSADSVERLQLKWFLYAVALSILGIIVGPMLHDVGTATSNIVASLGSLAVPVAVAIAVFRYRLYDIDIIINRTLVYVLLTAVLLATYASSVLLFRALLDPLAGDSDIAIAASTLAVAALFGPARRRIQAFIDRRFYRARYDARRTLDGFAGHLRDEVDLDVVAEEMLSVCRRTVQPAHAGVILVRRGVS